MKLLLDADMLLFKAMMAAEVEVEVEPDVWTRHSELPQAREAYWQQLVNWCDHLGCSLGDVVHCFTDASAFRRDLFPDYKASRKGKPKPIGFKAFRAEFLSEPLAFMYSQIEADDVIGILATQLAIDGEPYAIASGDKDLLQLPGLHLWTATSKEQESEDGLTVECSGDFIIKNATPEYAERFTYQQFLQGDATDGIPGCPGMGEVRAKRLVSSFDIAKPLDCWEAIVRAYEASGKVEHPREFATLQARLVRILRTGDYDFDSHAVSLWNPPTP